ncbi:MAG: TlpA family protein disulfide reductase [Bacteroidota bacterium]|nr:TlpA family protein disulfide reductase [Bacteroidota bacterium]
MLFKTRYILIPLIVVSCVFSLSAQSKLQAGTWRGVLKNSTGNELPFNFDVSGMPGHQQLAIINGAERFKVTDVKIKGDSVLIHMPLFNSEFKLKLTGKNLAGKWIKHLGDKDAAMDFKAEPGLSWRFFKTQPAPKFDVSGRWSAVFGNGTPGKEKLVGEFKQTGSKLTGTFLSISGDYRFLEGVVAGDQLYLSCFDGGHAFLFTAKIVNAKTIINGKFYSGLSGSDKWSAIRDANAKLPDAYSLTFLKPGDKKIAFTFRDINGRKVSLTDSRFKNKVVIVQILGSWCPNCMDETNYMVSRYYKKYHAKGVEVIGLAYERTTNFAQSQKTIRQLKAHFNIPYPILITGYTPAKGDPEKSLPMLADFKGFPTTIIIGKNGDVRKIHTGFSGPGTGIYYTQFIDEFEKLTDSLLAE